MVSNGGASAASQYDIPGIGDNCFRCGVRLGGRSRTLQGEDTSGFAQLSGGMLVLCAPTWSRIRRELADLLYTRGTARYSPPRGEHQCLGSRPLTLLAVISSNLVSNSIPTILVCACSLTLNTRLACDGVSRVA